MSLVRVERADHLATVTLARPEQRNAVSAAMLADLRSVFGDLAGEPDVRVVVLAGEDPDFCAGADIAELVEARRTGGGFRYGETFEQALKAIAEHPIPVIARVQGAALGAGCQLAVACDLAVAAEDARLGIPSGRLGIVVNYESIERLVLAAGPKRAGEMLYAGRVLSGIEAAEWGLVNRAVPAARLDAATGEVAGAIAGAAPLSVRGSKRGVAAAVANLRLDRASQGHRMTGFDMMAAEAFASEDLGEGIDAFRERRPPRFRGA